MFAWGPSSGGFQRGRCEWGSHTLIERSRLSETFHAPEVAWAVRSGGRERSSISQSRRHRRIPEENSMDNPITVDTLIAAPIDTVWRAYTTPDDIKKWNAASDDWHTTAAAVDLRVGGSFSSRMEAKDGSFGFDFTGTYTKIATNEMIEYSLGDHRAVRVTFDQTPAGVHVRVTFGAETIHSIEEQRAGWQAILSNFAKHVALRV